MHIIRSVQYRIRQLHSSHSLTVELLRRALFFIYRRSLVFEPKHGGNKVC